MKMLLVMEAIRRDSLQVVDLRQLFRLEGVYVLNELDDVAKFAFLEKENALGGKSSVRGRRISIILQLRGLEEVQAARRTVRLWLISPGLEPLRKLPYSKGVVSPQRDLVAGRTVGRVCSVAVFSARLAHGQKESI